MIQLNLDKFHVSQFVNFALPTTPQPILSPALPVFNDSSLPPWPRSSGYIWTTQLLPRIVYGPTNEILLSLKLNSAIPFSSAYMFPRSPICLLQLSGPPWCYSNGLKWEANDVQPSLKSPSSWIWKACC